MRNKDKLKRQKKLRKALCNPSRIYVYYGANEFDMDKFVPIGASDYLVSKPKRGTGFWASPVNAKFGWKDWCKSEGFNKTDFKKKFEFKLTESARILDVLSENSIPIRFVNRAFGKIIGLNFEELAKEYDAIELHLSKNWKLYYSFYGWDCDSILVMNPNVIIKKKDKWKNG